LSLADEIIENDNAIALALMDPPATVIAQN
jgi:hypothetical protein